MNRREFLQGSAGLVLGGAVNLEENQPQLNKEVVIPRIAAVASLFLAWGLSRTQLGESLLENLEKRVISPENKE